MKTRLLWVGILFSAITSFGQTPEQKAIITANYDQEYLSDLAEKFKKDAEAKREEALEMAALNNWLVTVDYSDGSSGELISVTADGNPIYYRTFDISSAASTRTNFLRTDGGLGLTLEGNNMEVGVWDQNNVLFAHDEFQGRAILNDNQSSSANYHSTRVTGILIAAGIDSQAIGMAPKATALTHNWTFDDSEVASFAAQGGLISNHSYGANYENVHPWFFGMYDFQSRKWDEIMYGAPYYLMVTAPGNTGLIEVGPFPLAPGYDKLVFGKSSKNALLVANAQDATLDSEGNLISVSISPTSTQGPTDDLRIKPDITGDGTNVYSCTTPGISDYSTSSGTSYSSPNVAGSLLLLQEHSMNVNGNFMRAATLKGLVLHTADDMLTPGPDAISGRGLLNARRAAETISGNGATCIIDERTLEQGETFSFSLSSDEINTLSVSISWTDYPGTSQVNEDYLPESVPGSPVTGPNPPNPRLKNDLNLRIIKDGITHFPYRLTSASTNGLGNNDVDPFEKIDVENAEGIYTVEISHAGDLVNYYQDYSLIITGASICTSSDTELQITQTVLNGETETESIIYDIKALNKIEDNGVASYMAGNSVTLKDGFWSQSGSALHALISQCSIISGQITGQRPAHQDGALTAETENNVLIYPNPAAENFTVELNQGNITEIIVRTLDGKNILSKKANERKYIVEANSLAKGIYILTIETDKNETFYKKLVIK